MSEYVITSALVLLVCCGQPDTTIDVSRTYLAEYTIGNRHVHCHYDSDALTHTCLSDTMSVDRYASTMDFIAEKGVGVTLLQSRSVFTIGDQRMLMYFRYNYSGKRLVSIEVNGYVYATVRAWDMLHRPLYYDMGDGQGVSVRYGEDYVRSVGGVETTVYYDNDGNISRVVGETTTTVSVIETRTVRD